jgi:hypothetical protein
VMKALDGLGHFLHDDGADRVAAEVLKLSF